MESVERRLLMAVDPMTDDVVASAMRRVSDLSQYSAGSLRGAREWAVAVDEGTDLGRLVQKLGASRFTATNLIEGVYVASFPLKRTGQSIARALETFNAGNLAWPLISEQVAPRLIPNDPTFPNQWHLRNTGQGGGVVGADANVTTAWDEYLGDGVVIGIVDDGVSPAHPDLAPNYRADLSWDWVGNDPDPSGGSHGASVAGVAGAKGNNGIGVSGAAPNAQHAGLKLLGATSDSNVAGALAWRKNDIAIYNNSWGPSDSGSVLGGAGPLALAALADAAQTGRNGLGNIWAWAAGNGGNNDNVNADSYANSRYTVSVAAITNSGVRSSYSERGAPNLVAAYSNGGSLGISTTASGSGYTSSFGGTSSASPLAAGVIALMLDANPTLTWRDVQHVLVNSAEKIDPTNADWKVNGAGHDVNHFYGYGGIDAQAAVNLAETWTNVAPEVTGTTGTVNVNQPIPNNVTTGLTHTVDVTDAIKLETVELVFDAAHTRRGDLQILLTSPSGTESVIMTERPDSGDWITGQKWVFSTKLNWDEDARGTWTLKVIDDSGADAGTLNNYKLNFYGSQLVTTPSVYGTVYDDANANGARDGGEVGLPGVQVYVDANNDGDFDAGEPTTNTTATGSYGLSDLALGQHVVRSVAPAGLRASQPAGGSYTVNLTSGQNFSTNNNFGFVNPRIAGTVFNDFNDNGAFDTGEAGLTGITVFLDANNNGTLDGGEQNVASGAGGAYSLGGLADGQYLVRAVTPSGRRLTLPGGNGSHAATISNTSLAVLGQNFGLTDRARVGGVVYNDANGNGQRDAGETGIDGARVYDDLNDNGTYDNITQAHNATNVPVAFPAGTANANSTLTVGGGPAIITKVTVRLNITHTWDEDLDVFLVGPSGTRVELFTDVGGSGDNFTNTVLDDAAATSITAGTAPFAGTYRPEGSLAAFAGTNANGTWRLEITDDVASVDGGTLNSWSLTINATEPSVLSSSSGAYAFNALPPGSFRMRQVPLTGQSITQPATGSYNFTFTGGEIVGNADFGNSSVAAPAVSAAEFLFDGPNSTLPNPPHKMNFTFSQQVGNSVDAGDLQLVNTTTNTTVPTANVAVTYNTATRTATFTFPGYTDGVLPDGQYTATLLGAGIVTDVGGTPMGGNYVTNFFVLAGDANHDGTVNLADFNVLAENFGQSNQTFGEGDFNYDGTVNLTDFNILAAKFGQSADGSASRNPGRLPAPPTGGSARALGGGTSVSFGGTPIAGPTQRGGGLSGLGEDDDDEAGGSLLV
jgi:subtilisin-like proprotein convertase family protein